MFILFQLFEFNGVVKLFEKPKTKSESYIDGKNNTIKNNRIIFNRFKPSKSNIKFGLKK